MFKFFNDRNTKEEETLTPFHVIPLERFTPSQPKHQGSRPGCLGKLDGSNEFCMLKIENFSYPISCTNNADESVALESLSSHLIRAIFGARFAAEINIIEMNGSPSTPCQITYDYLFKLGIEKRIVTETITAENKYAVLSNWEENASSISSFEFTTKAPETSSEKGFAIEITQIQTIAKLINMSDYKPENIVKRKDGSLFLVDCASNFHGHECQYDLLSPVYFIFDLRHYFVKEAALEIIQTFATCPVIKIKNVLDQFANVMSLKTRENILIDIVKTQIKCKQFLSEQQEDKKKEVVIEITNPERNSFQASKLN